MTEETNLGKNRQRKARGLGEGNTGPNPVQLPRRKYYTFTLFNYDDEVKIELNRQLVTLCDKYQYGEEICPTTGRPHLQGFVNLKKPRRITELKRVVNQPKFIPCSGNEEHNLRYTSKDGIVTRYGFPAPIEIITVLRPWQAEVEKLCFTKPDDRTVFWYWEPVGKVGKSAFIKYMAVKHRAIVCQGGKHSDIINLIFNTDMDKSNIVLFDIPRAHRGNISYSALECIKTGMVCNTKYETGFKVFNPPHIIVFANFPPECPENLSEDKWMITELA